MSWLLGLLLLLAACLLAGAMAGAMMEVKRLHAKMWACWAAEDRLRRQLAVEVAGRAHDQATYRRRVDRWRAYVVDLQEFAVQEGLLSQWRLEADRQSMPWVDSEPAPL